MKSLHLVPCLLIWILGCAHFEKTSLKLTLDSVEKLKVSRDDKNQAVLLLGEPNLVFQSEYGDSAWVYLEKSSGYQRLSLNFDKAGKLQGIVWAVSGKQAEVTLDAAKARYPKGNFLMEDPEWINPHTAPNERFYTDYKNGIQITLGRARNEVEGISWFDPNQPPKKPTKNDYVFYFKENGLASIKPKKIETWLEVDVAREVASLGVKAN